MKVAPRHPKSGRGEAAPQGKEGRAALPFQRKKEEKDCPIHRGRWGKQHHLKEEGRKAALAKKRSGAKKSGRVPPPCRWGCFLYPHWMVVPFPVVCSMKIELKFDINIAGSKKIKLNSK